MIFLKVPITSLGGALWEGRIEDAEKAFQVALALDSSDERTKVGMEQINASGRYKELYYGLRRAGRIDQSEIEKLNELRKRFSLPPALIDSIEKSMRSRAVSERLQEAGDFLQKGNAEGAERSFKAALAIDPGISSVISEMRGKALADLLEKVRVARQKGDTRNAIDHLQMAIKLDPDNKKLRSDLSTLSLELLGKNALTVLGYILAFVIMIVLIGSVGKYLFTKPTPTTSIRYDQITPNPLLTSPFDWNKSFIIPTGTLFTNPITPGSGDTRSFNEILTGSPSPAMPAPTRSPGYLPFAPASSP